MSRKRPPFFGFSSRAQDSIHAGNRTKIVAFVKQRCVDFTHREISKSVSVRSRKNRCSFGFIQSSYRTILSRCTSNWFAPLACKRCTRDPQSGTRRALADLASKLAHDFLEFSSSNALSPARSCKSACAFPSAATVRSDLSRRRVSRAFSSRNRRSSTAWGSGGRPRFVGAPSTRCLRQLLISELYTPFTRKTVARSIGVLADSYSAKMRALSLSAKPAMLFAHAGFKFG